MEYNQSDEVKLQIERLKARYDAAKKDRMGWERQWQDITDYVVPMRGDFTYEHSKGSTRRFDRIFNNSGPMAAQALASLLYTQLTSATEKWFELGFTGESDVEQEQWLEQATNRMNDDVFTNAETGFTNAISETYLDLCSYGTAVLMVEDRPGEPITFKTVHLSEVCVATNARGYIDTVYRMYKMTGSQLRDQYPNAIAEEIWIETDRDPGKEYNILIAIEPLRILSPDDESGKHFKYTVIMYDDYYILDEGSYYENPFIVPRWSVMHGQTYGTSQAMMSLPNIKLANEVARVTLKAGQKSIDPVLLVPDDGVLQPINSSPGAIIYYKNMFDGKPPVQPLQTANPEFGIAFLEFMAQAIGKDFYVDDMKLGKEKQEMTATEVYQRREDRMMTMGPIIGRIQAELLQPLIYRVFMIMKRRGLIPPPPTDDDRSYTIRYISPMVRAMKAGDAHNVARAFQLIAPLAQVDPTVLDSYNMHALGTWMGDRLDIPKIAMRTPEEIAQIQQERAQAQKEAQDAETSKMQSETLANVSKAVSNEGGSDAR